MLGIPEAVSDPTLPSRGLPLLPQGQSIPPLDEPSASQNERVPAGTRPERRRG